MRLSILPAAFLGFATTWATSYHFAADGDDLRTTAQAGDPATPWKSLAKIVSTTLLPGDSILLRRGDVWREAMLVKQSGAVGKPIVIAPYGDGSARPQLIGTIPLAGTPVGDRYAARVPGGQNVTAVFADRVKLRCARFPDTGWTIASSVEGDSAVSAPDLGGKSWVGASIHLRTSMWTLETHRVVSQQGGRLVLDKKAIYGPPDSVRFFLSNHNSAIASAQAWAYASKDSMLRWSGPATVEASVLPTLIDLTGANHVQVRGVHLFGSTIQAVKSGGTGIGVEDCEIFEPGLLGIKLAGRQGVFRNNRIEGAGNGALVGSGALHRIEANHIRRTALLSDFGPSGMGDGCCGGRAIDFNGDSNTVSRNIIDSTGYIGIGFRGLSTLVEENDVAHSCMTTDDCGGIYTYVGNYLDAGSKGTVIRRNFVRDPVGAPSGWPRPWDASIGIYLDDGSHDIRVDSNVVWGNATGIFLHNTRRAVVRGNIAFGNRNAQLSMSHDKLAGAGDMFDNQLEGNLLVALPSQGAEVQIGVHQAQTLPLGSLTGNILCTDQILSASCQQESLSLWQRAGIENTDPRLGPETQANGLFDSAKLGWSAWPSQVKLSLDSGAACVTGHCLKVSYVGDTASRSPLANCSRTVSTVQGQAWRLSFRARAQNPGQKLSPAFRRSSGDYAPLGYSSPVRLDTAWTTHSILIRASMTEPSARVDFHNSRTDSVYWLDEVSLRSIPDSVVRNLPTARLLANPTASESAGMLAGVPWMDAWGAPVSTELVVPPWQAKVVFPYAGRVTSIANHGSVPRLRIHRVGNRWDVDGLDGSARIFDARGKMIAYLSPDATGHASWTPKASLGMYWLRSATETRVLFKIR